MPQTVEYRLTIRNASTVTDPNGTADELVVTSIRLGTNPYIAAAPSGDGTEIDPLTGATRTGAYVVEVVDANTGTDATGTIRVVTNKLEDATYRQQLLSRRAYVDVIRDSGASSRLIAGYISNIRLISPMRYAITVGDTRRVERTQTIFQGAALGSYTTRGCFLGGPVTQDFGTIKSRGGWEYTLTNIGTSMWEATFVRGYGPKGTTPNEKDWRKLINPRAQQVLTSYTQPNPFSSGGAPNTYDFCFASTDTQGNITDGVVAFIGSSATNAVATNAVIVDSSEIAEDNPLSSGKLVFYWPSCPYSSGSKVYISLTTANVTESCPLYLDAHPVDLVTAIWTAARVNYNASGAWITTVRNLIGANVRLACRFADAPKMDEFLTSAIYGPFGVAERTDSEGRQELVPARIKVDTLPTLQLTAAAMRGYEEVVFDLDEQTAVSGIRLTQQLLAPAEFYSNPINAGGADQSTTDDGPLDGVTATEFTQTAEYQDPNLAVFAGKVIEYKVPGMIHTAADFVPNTGSQLAAIAVGTFDRFGRGCQAAEVAVLQTAAVAAAQVGDEIYFEAPHFPNKGYRIGESNVGARIMQVVRRTETPEGPVFRLLDSGLAAQPVAPAATITATQNPNAPSTVARFTITNAAAINATGVLQVRIEWATGASAPTGNGADFALYTAGQVPTGAVDLPPVTTAGTTVYVRARTEQAGRRPSAWTAWASVALVNIPTPSGAAVSNIRQTAATLTWTNTSNTLALAVFASPGIGAPASWTPYRVGTLPARSTSTIIRSLTGPSVAWTLGVAYETAQAVGPVASVAMTTNSTLDTPTRPAGLAVIPGVDDATLTQGIALALWASDQTLDLVIQRSTTSGSGFATIATVAGSTSVYVDQLPRNGTTYYYRIAHTLGGYATSTYTAEVSATPRGVPPNVARPGAVAPVVQVATTEVGTTATVTLTITDPQNRVTLVRFRDRTNGGAWSAWTNDSTVPYTYSATIPSSGYVQIEYEVQGFDAAGTSEQVLAGGVESFDLGTGANMVSVVGTFTSASAMNLAISADSDTASIRFATSTVSQPTLATVQAQTAINQRNYSTLLPGPYSSGTTVYVSVLGYTAINGGGTESALFQYQFTRDAGGLTYSQCIATMAASSATQIVVTVTGTAATGSPTVQLVAVTGSATLASGAAIGTPVASGSQWTFNRGAALGQPGGAQFRAVLAGTQSDDDFIEIPEQGRDTTYLASRARVIATTDTTVTARYAVADPYPQGANTVTVAYQNLGSPGVTPASGGTLTPQATLTEAAGTYIDYTITRPPFGSGTARVTYTATAANRVSDSDAVDVPAVERDTISLSARARVTSTTATTQVVRVAVADPQPTVPITSITGATVTTSGPHNQTGTFTVVISGNSNAAYNGTWTATVLTSITFNLSTSSTSGTGGTAAPQNYCTIAYSVTGLATPTQVGGAALPGTITVTPQTALNEAAGTYYDFQITRPASAQPPGRINFTVTAGGRAPAAPAASVVAQDIVGPSLKVVTTPAASLYSMLITYDGTISYSLDGVAQSTAGWTSPYGLVVARNEYLGATQVVALSVARDGSTVSETVNVPPKDNANASITIGTQTADNVSNTYTFTWSTSGMPTGTTYDLTYTTTTTSGVVEQGTLNSQTSPVNVVSAFSIGLNPKYQMTVTAIKSGTLVLVKSRSGTFLV